MLAITGVGASASEFGFLGSEFAMRKGRLNVKKIERLTKPGRYGDGGNLFLQVVNDRNKSWLFRYARDGRERMLGLGPLHTWNLDEARERAHELRQQLGRGIDPLAARKAERAERALAATKAITFEDAAQQYYDAHQNEWKNLKHRAQFLSTLRTYAYPLIAKLPVAELNTGLVLRIVEPLWATKRETASRLRGRIERVLDFATVRGYRVGDNPARWTGHLSEALPARIKKKEVRHHPALPFEEVPEFMAKLRARPGTSARALEFLILTASRTGATIGARRCEVDLRNRVWSVPPERAGAKIDGDKPRRIPLSDRAAEIVQDLPVENGNEFLFVGPHSGLGLSDNALLALIDRMGYGERTTAHGFRSSFKDWVSETTSYPNHVSEAALWHAVADKVEAAYRRGDLFAKRRRLMDDWARYCESTSVRKKGDNVVPINRSAGK